MQYAEWEYQQIAVTPGQEGELLAKLGADGWELCAVLPGVTGSRLLPAQQQASLNFFLKRVKLPPWELEAGGEAEVLPGGGEAHGPTA